MVKTAHRYTQMLWGVLWQKRERQLFTGNDWACESPPLVKRLLKTSWRKELRYPVAANAEASDHLPRKRPT